MAISKVEAPSKIATLSLIPSSITMEVGASSGVITIKNESSTVTASALGFTANINLVNNSCTDLLPPQGECSFQVEPNAPGQYSVTVQGSNTTAATLTVEVSEVIISLSPETLTLPVGNSGIVTVRNDSSSTAVSHLQVNNLPVGIEIDATSTCVIGGSLPAGGHCSFVFRANAATASTAVIVKGNNTNEALLTLSATTTTISVSPQTSPPLILNADGVDEAVFIVTNTGTGVAAHIDATAVATPAWVGVALVPSLGCADLAPGSNDCTITVSSSTANVAGYLTVQGTNTNPVNTDYIAFRAGGGLVFSREENTPSPGDTTIKVVSESDDSTSIRWDSSTQCAGVNCTPIPAARNLNNGQANTQAIVLALTGQPGVTSTNYAAGLCSEKDMNGYNDWYLPAICELGASSGSPVGEGSCSIASIYTNLYAHDFPVFASPGSIFYWSSTEYPFNTVYAQSLWFPAGSVVGQFEDDRKLNDARVRCVRAFIP